MNRFYVSLSNMLLIYILILSITLKLNKIITCLRINSIYFIKESYSQNLFSSILDASIS